ncbi:MAG: OsmC family peroxiredoxin [Actinomycetota bacterium]|nr:OsmC family peroxiredoxin [Actinomycetota bacterium]
MATRRAEATWEGSLAEGQGRAELESGVAGSLDVNWKARTEGGVQTSPEELLAAAHAACFSMALSHTLSEGGNEPRKLSVAAAVSFDAVEGGFAVTTSRLKVRGDVPGIDADAFQEAARGAAEGCPISGALSGNVDIVLESVELAE